jgi:radical SAM peptide maturase (CXXX-repeat target family)/CXXX repeat peptide maturase
LVIFEGGKMNDKGYELGSGISTWMNGMAHDITFIVTQDCNLRCKYCYQVNKNSDNIMSFDTAKKAIDYFINNRETFAYKAVVWEFIGGEPFLEIDLIDKITDYIKLQLFKNDHPWFSLFRLNFSTNGILYDDKKVQRYIAKNNQKCNIGITIDGTKEKHDLQRIYANGKGSYNDVVKNIPLWLKQFPGSGTKVTFGSDDLKYLKDSIIHLWSLGIKNVPANVVFEDVWKSGDDKIFEKQLKELADYIIDNRLWNKYDTTLFDDKLGGPISDSLRKKNRCGAGMMIAIDSKGNFYPCLRYAEYSLEKAPAYIIGNVEKGIDFDKVRPFIGLSLETQCDEECINCEIVDGCAWCQGHNYDTTFGVTNYKRAKYICNMHKARYKANEYYWSRLREEFNIHRYGKIPKSRHLYFITDDNCIEHCNYTSHNTTDVMSDEVIQKGLKFAEDNFYTPIILNSKNNKNIKNINKFSILDRIEIYSNDTTVNENNQKKFQVVSSKTIELGVKSDVCILNLEFDEIKDLYKFTKILYKSCDRVNLNVKYDTRDIDFNFYEDQLRKVSNLIIDIYKKTGVLKELNKITDILFIKDMENCNAGEKNFALAPNGKIYPCPKFYFEDKSSYIGDLELGIDQNDSNLFEYKNAPVCNNCTVYHCDRCVYLNKKFTLEYNTPSSIQCKIGSVEKKISIELINLLQVLSDNKGSLKIDVNLEDPLIKLVEQRDINPYALSAYTIKK